MPKGSKEQKPLKSETLAIRVDPKTKYGLEILARIQRRSVTSVVEWAINQTLRENLRIEKSYKPKKGTSLFAKVGWDEYFLDDIWDGSEVIRLIKLIDFNSDLLTYEEELLWRLIRNNACYWNGELLENEDLYVWDTSDISKLRTDLVIHDWQFLKDIAEGRASDDPEEFHFCYFSATGLGKEDSAQRSYAIHLPEEVELIKDLMTLSKPGKETTENLRNLITEWAEKIVRNSHGQKV